MRVSQCPRVLLMVLLVFPAGCSESHGGADAERSVDGGSDAGLGGGCGSRPESPQCEALCRDACSLLSGCGVDEAACLEDCFVRFACPGETVGHDTAICEGTRVGSTCDSACAFAEGQLGHTRCPTAADAGATDAGAADAAADPGPADAGARDGGAPSCDGRGYCDCHAGCEPLIDLSTGCVCECDEPFNCSGATCACFCGGATYLGCAPAGRCAETQIDCGDCPVIFDDAGCPTCDISGCS